MLSNRGQKLVSSPSQIVEAHMRCFEDPYHEDHNSKGYINLGTAENYLVENSLSRILCKFQHSNTNYYHYQYSYGTKSLREKLASFISEHISYKISEEELVLTSGCSAALEAVSHALFDEGDGVFILAPYYVGFRHDLSLRFGLELLEIPAFESSGPLISNEMLELAYRDAIEEGKKPKAFLFNNPHNPTGHVFNEQESKIIVDFCKKYELEILADDIYALSIHDCENYQPLWETAPEYSSHIHVFYGLAKDFGLSGFKVGAFFSKNKDLISAMRGEAYFYTVSAAAQEMLEYLLDQIDFDDFFKPYCQMLSENYQLIKAFCERLQIPIYPSQGGFFTWVDLRKFRRDSAEDLFERIFENAKVSISPGDAFGSHIPDQFRICFARERKVLEVALQRLEECLL